MPAFPVAVDDSFTVHEGSNTLNVLANDPFGQQVQVSSFTQPAAGQGALAENADGTFTFTPAAGFTGAQFSYTLSPKNAQTTLTANDPTTSRYFGLSVAVSRDGNTAAVSALSGEGVWVFVRSGAGWVPQATLPDPGVAADTIGPAVSLSGDGSTLLVAATRPNNPGDTERAFVFVRSGGSWTQQATLSDPDGVPGGGFGTAISLSDDGSTAAISETGKVYVYVRSGGSWTRQATVANPAAGDNFGTSVSLSGDGNTLLVGASNATVGGQAGSGKAYVFTRSGGAWSLQETFAPLAAFGYGFGAAVALSADGSTAAVTASGATVGDQVRAGKVYVFVRSGGGWAYQAALPSPSPKTDDGFGASLSLSGDGNALLAGAFGSGVGGKAYLFGRSGGAWSLQTTYLDPAAGSNDAFGFPVSLSGDGNTLLVGASLANVPGKAYAGKAFVLERGTSTATVTLAPQSTTPSPSPSPSAPARLPNALAVSGSPDGAAQLFTFDAAGNLQPQAGPFAPFAGFSGDLRTAVADVDGDGTPDTVYGIGPGGGSTIRVKTSGGTDASIDVYEAGFTGGVFLAAGDIDGDGKAEIVVSPDVGGGGRVVVFKLQDGQLVRIADFFGIDDPSFRGGARVSVGDVNGDGTADVIVAAGFGGGPRVAVFDGRSVLANGSAPAKLFGDFFVFEQTLRNGVFVGSGDFNADGKSDLVFGGGPGGGPRVMILDAAKVVGGDVAGAIQNPLANFFAGDRSQRGGVRVAAKDIDGDSLADLITGSGEGSPAHVRTYLGKNVRGAANGQEPTLLQDFPAFGGGASAAGVFVG